MKARKSGPTNDESFELKYCERCGGLWLRPVSSGQIYCVACSGEMAKLPPSSSDPERRRGRPVADDGSPERYGTDVINLEPLGGVA